MQEYNVSRMIKSLGLKHKIVGLKFLYRESDYDECKFDNFGKHTSYCYMVKNATEGNAFKAMVKNFACRCSLEALGLAAEMDCVVSGERYYSIGLYKSRAIAKAAQSDVIRINQKTFGIAMGPLEEMDDCDVVIFMVNPYQLMRVIQGYTYQYGVPKNFRMAGNQGICSDLAARPFETNDMNFSILCAGARRICKWDDCEMGVGMPIHFFQEVVEGVIQTLNLVEYPDTKLEIEKRLTNEDELGIMIDKDIHYGKLGSEYTNPKLEE